MSETLEAKGQNGQVYFDGQFVTIARKEFVARNSVGKGEKRIPIGSITAVQWKPAAKLSRGFIEFTFAGGNERRSKFGSQVHTAFEDENTVVFLSRQMPAFETIRAAIEAAISGGAAISPAIDLTDQLHKLAGLRDAGVLTEEEFTTKKAELLARM